MIHFQGQKVGSRDFGLLKREAQSSQLAEVDGVPPSVASVVTWVWPSSFHSSELCVLSVKIVKLWPGLDRERLRGTWSWKPRWNLLLTCCCPSGTVMLRRGEAADTFLCVMQETAESLGTFLLTRDPECSPWGAALRPLSFAHYFF